MKGLDWMSYLKNLECIHEDSRWFYAGTKAAAHLWLISSLSFRYLLPKRLTSNQLSNRTFTSTRFGCWSSLRQWIYHFNFNFLDLKAENDGPHETEDEPRVAIDYIFGADTLQTNLWTVPKYYCWLIKSFRSLRKRYSSH